MVLWIYIYIPYVLQIHNKIFIDEMISGIYFKII